jgi:hypothetical protein
MSFSHSWLWSVLVLVETTVFFPERRAGAR